MKTTILFFIIFIGCQIQSNKINNSNKDSLYLNVFGVFSSEYLKGQFQNIAENSNAIIEISNNGNNKIFIPYRTSSEYIILASYGIKDTLGIEHRSLDPYFPIDGYIEIDTMQSKRFATSIPYGLFFHNNIKEELALYFFYCTEKGEKNLQYMRTSIKLDKSKKIFKKIN